jgi:hypothetical protein
MEIELFDDTKLEVAVNMFNGRIKTQSGFDSLEK